MFLFFVCRMIVLFLCSSNTKLSKKSMKRIFVIIVWAWLGINAIYAQRFEGPFMSWDEFVASYLDNEVDDEGLFIDEDMREWLERTAEHPLQINRTTKADLMAFPFLNEQQVDSLLVYRAKRRGFGSLGELQLVSGMDYYSRCFLSVFVRCDSAYVEDGYKSDIRLRISDFLSEGSHEVESRLDVPLYKRKGYDVPAKPSATNYYVGNPLHHIVRYRYRYGKEAAYGLTMEKDAGEPVAKRGFYPYDYWSGYVMLRPFKKRWSIFLGDFQIRAANGLLYGKGGFLLRAANGIGTYRPLTFSPHTSSDESHYFRGLAYSQSTAKGWKINAFVSHRRLDARLTSNGDTAQSLQQTGLHRTLSEIEMRRSLGSFTSGVGVSMLRSKWGLELNECLNVYSKPYSSPHRYYNEDYFRGRTSSTMSLSYYVRPKNFFINGECAVDKRGYLSTLHHVGYTWSHRSHVAMEMRYFSPKYVSLYASPLQQGSRAANEMGVTMSLRYVPVRNVEVSGYVDWAEFIRPTFQAAIPHSKGVNCFLQTQYASSSSWTLSMAYRLRSKQYTLNLDEKKTLEYRITHKLRMASSWSKKRWNATVQADACLYTTQIGERQVGWMCSVRSGWSVSSKLSVKGFVACFFTDDYDSRLYAYQPQLPRSYSMQAFADHGVDGVVLLSWCPVEKLTLSLRASSLKYFNRDSISSRLDRISSSWKNDVSVQVRWVMKERKHGKY